MRLTKEADYAVRCVLDVAGNGWTDTGRVAHRQNVPASFLGKIVQSLARAGILTTRRGVGGGVRLARPADSVTLLEIVEAVQGPLTVNACGAGPEACECTPDCPAYPVFLRAQKALRDVLCVPVGNLLDSRGLKPVAAARDAS
ncbi:MAG: Rrf2 family transcriptional regulator [Acidobacteria bacterium]|nr:Rrf2 family transcriptional regulator [Acidobacteriota bacterium]